MNRPLDRIQKTALRMEELVGNLRGLQAVEDSKVDVEMAPTSILEILDEALSNFEDKLKNKNISLEFDRTLDSLDKRNLVLLERVSALNSVLGNVLSNAIKFSRKGGSIAIQLIHGPSSLVLRIKDQGIGMDGELLKKVFSRTEKTTRPGTESEAGTGFGMPLVKLFMEKFGGEVSIESVAESSRCGTTISLQFKRAYPEVAI